MRGMDVGVDTHGNDRRVPGRHGLPALFEEEGEGVTGEPTVPVPISDLLAFIDEFEHYDVVGWGDPDEQEMIVRGVRDLAARVETLTALLEKHGGHAPGCFREKLFGAEGCICGWDQVRAELTDDALARIAVQSTTETPS